jgi:hypothetical protein
MITASEDYCRLEMMYLTICHNECLLHGTGLLWPLRAERRGSDDDIGRSLPSVACGVDQPGRMDLSPLHSPSILLSVCE